MTKFYNKAKNDQWEEQNVAMSVIARFGTGGGNTPVVINDMDTYSIQRSDEYKESGIASTIAERDYKSATDLILRNGDEMAVDCRNGTESEINGTMQAKPNGGMSLNTNQVCRTKNIVRRLTPLECERLQGFPDGWTDIGDWVDSNGKKHKAADSPRYKALGNSIATPFWFYLLRRISAQYERPATLGSLFDGIGGFPYCWERCNGKGTAIWASEIEEFPIAVTKARFSDTDVQEEHLDANGNDVEQENPIMLESNQNHATVQTEGISTALPASMGMGGGYVPMITDRQI